MKPVPFLKNSPTVFSSIAIININSKPSLKIYLFGMLT